MLAGSGLLFGVACSAEREPESTPAAETKTSLSQRVPAGELSQQLLGASMLDVSYEQLAGGAPLVRVVALDATGGQLGELVIDGQDPAAPIRFTARDGSKASAVGSIEEHGDLVVEAVTYRTNGAHFTMGSEHRAGHLVGVVYATGRDGAQENRKHLPSPEAEGFSDQVKAWTSTNTDFAVLDSTHALREMYVLGSDAAWQTALAEMMGASEKMPHQHPGDGNIGQSQEALHKSAACSQFLAVIASGGIAAAACTICGPAGVAIFFSEGLAAFVAIPACLTCVVAVGLGVVDLALCMTSYFNAFTLQQCQDEAPPWADGTLDPSEHTCANNCNIQKCNAYCTAQGQTNNSCLKNRCSCVPPPDPTGPGGGPGPSSATASTGGPPEYCFTCTSGQCMVDSHCGVTVYCSGSCPPEYDCQYGGCVRTTVTICNCDGTDPPGTCLNCGY
ncbi:MAG: hypothetical protein WKG00_31415 [Polyangiaceae bacterium]